jgi:SAM-dependent methyltransferase
VSAGFEPIAQAWIAHVRAQEDRWYEHNAACFFELLPAPGRATLDVGCGEGRLGRALLERGYHVVGVDLSPTLAAHARESFDVVEADAAALPFATDAFDLVVAFMSLMDIDDLDGAVREAARVLEPGGRFCLAVSHPILTAGDGEPFTIAGSYLEPHRYRGLFPSSGLDLESWHRPLEAYSRALEAAGFVVESLRELPGVNRPHLPISLHARARHR